MHDYAHVTLNGKEVGARSFQPYRWDVTDAVKKGTNDLKIEVYGTASQNRGAGAPPAAAGGGGRGGPAAPATSGLLGPVKLVAY